ncbi:hypothetical protein ACJMK2_006424 [Sinanodonta woodiana]|uniref:Poly [ADP-ribose] polymerase n=1 Tax=Sinanodonta woodiana TaxID=1069815 RepID=A0ABD3VUR0_SINWO
MAKLQPGDVAKRCLCINGVPGDVQINEICVNFTGLFDVHVAKNGKHVFLFKDEQAALLQLQQTPKITLKHGRAPNNNICLTVNRCDVDDINTSWLIPNQSKVEQGTSYFNEAAAEEPLYQNPAQFLSFNNEQTYEWNWGNNPNQHQQMHEWNRGNNPNQHQQPTDTSAIHPPPGMGSYGPGWGQYPHPNQYYPGFQHPPGSGQNFYQDGNQQIPSMPNPSHFAHGPWYGPGFPPYGPQGMGYPSTGGMHEGRDQQVPPAIYQWGSMTQPHGVQMPHTNEPGPGSGHLPQYSQHLQHGPPPPFESSKDGSSVTKVKSSVSDTTSDDHNKETKLQPYMATKSPSQKEAVSPEDVATVDRDEFPEIKKKKQEGQGGTAVKNNEKDEPVIKMKVTKLPEDTTEDTLMNYFENRRRSGGGTIKSIEYHPATSSAIIEFEEVEAIDRVLNKAPLLFLKKQISVEEYVEEVEDTEEEEEEPSCRTIEVRGFAENTSEEVLEMYFENTKRSGGGEVTSVVIEGGVALVTFLDKDVVSSVLEREHTVDGQSLTVTLHVPKKKPSAMEVEEEEDEPLCTIEVRGYKTMSEDTLQMYFENTKRSGGDEIIKFELIKTDRIIFITFASEEVAKNVAEREHVVGGCNLKVKLYVPPKRKSARNLSRTTSNEPEESVPHCTIEVKGVSQKICGTLQFYFENTKRSGGDEIVKFEHKETDEIAYITFGSEDVAKRVVSHGQHKVEGQLLEVKLYIPPPPRPIYDDRVLLTGFTSKVTQDGLTNFLEAKTGLTPVKYVYGEDEGKVIITFQETIDFEKLEEACKKRPLEGSYLVPSKVYVSNSIIISNLKTTTTEDTIQLYFENEKRSYGGPVEKVEFKREEEYCLVFFEDHTICDRVLQRKHKIDGSELQVSIYYESLGRISEDDNGPSFKPPKPLKLEMLEFAKMQFLMRSEPNRTALEKQLQDCFTQIQWPKTETDCTILTCTLTSDVPDCKKKALTWAKQAEQNLHDFLKVISVHNLEVFQEIFETVLQNIQNLTIAKPDGVALFVKNVQFCIQVVGHKAVATVVVKDIEDIIKKAESDFDRKKKQTKETLTNLKYYQLRLLLAQKYPSKTEKQFNGLKVKINTNKNEIVFEGLMEDIRVAKVVMYETIHNAAVTQLKNLPEGRLVLYKSKEVKDYIVAKLKSKKLAGVWDVEGSNLNIYANSDEAVVQSAHIINDSVKEHQRDLKSSQRSAIESQQWKDKMKNLEQQNHGKLHVVLAPDYSKLCLYFTDDILGLVCEEVDDFLSRNTILEQLVACNSGMIKLIEKKDNNEVDKIAKDLSHCYVQITIQSKGGFLVRGNQEGISQATYRLQQLVQKINHCDHELIKPGIAQYMESKGREHIFAVENQIPCVIQLKEQEQYGSGKNEEEPERFGMVGTRGSGPAIQAECKSYGLEKIFSALGDITEIDVDVLVNAADPKLEHRGGVAKAMVDKGGRDIREECMQHVRKNGHLAEGEIHVTSAGHLRAKIIIHAVSPVWKGGHNNEEEVLRETIFKCMETAAKNKLKSIAIPALGSGVFGWPPDKSTKVIAEAVKDFFREDQESSIMEVYLSDINPETVRYFTEALEKSFGKQRVTEVKQRPTPTPRNIKGFTLPGAVAVMPRMPVDVLSSQPSNFGRILVKVVKGEMASEKVEVIVNTTSKSLDLTNGAVSQSLLTKGGQTLQDECKKKYPNGIKDGDIAVTGGGHLSCKIVCHLALAKWTDETKSKKMLNVLMKKCLDQCEKNGYTSIAFPALGTGNLGFPKDIVAKEMFKHISTYSRDNPSSSVTDVRFVVYQKDIPTVQAFESAQQEWSSSGTGLGTLTRQNIQSSQYGEESWNDDIFKLRLNPTIDISPRKPIIKSVTQPDFGSKIKYMRKLSQPRAFQNETNLENILHGNFWLPDEHIDMAMKLIKQAYPDIQGLEDASVIAVGSVKKNNGPFLQIYHSKGGHWITITNINCTTPATVKVYDCRHRFVHKSTLLSIFKMLMFNPSQALTIEMPKFQKQKSESECGPFAIAAAVSLVLGKEPSVEIYDEDNLRPHLFHCLKSNSLKAFPTVLARVNMLEYKKFVLFQCCQCDFPIFEGQTKGSCRNCGLPYHADKCSSSRRDFCRKCGQRYNFQ